MEKNNHQNENGSGFMNGFFWGMIVGGAIVFLLGTKKGKKVLKFITEEGLEGISDIREAVEESTLGSEMEAAAEMDEEDFSSVTNNTTENKDSHSLRHFPRRFFRGTPKKQSTV